MAGLAIVAIAATGVVGGFAIAHGAFNSALNATNAKSLTYSHTVNPYVSGSESYVAKTIATGTFNGDSGIATTLKGSYGCTLQDSSETGSGYASLIAPSTSFLATLTFTAGCQGMTSIIGTFNSDASVTFATYSSQGGSSVGSGSLKTGVTQALAAGSNYIEITFNAKAAGEAVDITTLTLNWAC